MRRLAEDVHLLRGLPPYVINVYLVGDVIVDAGTRHARRRILRQVRGRAVRAHALTHAHPDHQGSSHAICETLALPLWCGQNDVPVMEGTPRGARSAVSRAIARVAGGPPHPVQRPLREGDEVAGFAVLDAPGHSPGHVAYWRESDRVLILGDVFFGLNPVTGVPGLHEPPQGLSADPALNRRSARRLAALRPALVCFGHGPPLRDPDRLSAFAESLPED